MNKATNHAKFSGAMQVRISSRANVRNFDQKVIKKTNYSNMSCVHTAS